MNQGLNRIISILKDRCLRKVCARNIVSSHKLFAAPPTQSYKGSKGNLNELENRPVEFFGSKAATWHAKDGRSGDSDEMLWYQPYVISGSIAVFLIYFCILREESDIDRKLEGSLYDHISGLEESQLIISYRYNRENGLEVKEIANRLKELGIDPTTLT